VFFFFFPLPPAVSLRPGPCLHQFPTTSFDFATKPPVPARSISLIRLFLAFLSLSVPPEATLMHTPCRTTQPSHGRLSVSFVVGDRVFYFPKCGPFFVPDVAPAASHWPLSTFFTPVDHDFFSLIPDYLHSQLILLPS